MLDNTLFMLKKLENCYIWANLYLYDSFNPSSITYKWFNTNKLYLYMYVVDLFFTCQLFFFLYI